MALAYSVPDPVFLVNAGVPISDTSPFTIVVQIPPNVDAKGNNQLSIRNTHTSATMYFKWSPIGTSRVFDIADAGVVLPAGIGWDTRLVPPGQQLIARSSVNGAVCALDVEAMLKR